MFRSIALGGGGMRGGIHVGALTALHAIRGNLEFPDGIYGCSVGSIVATAVAFRIPPDVMRTMFEQDFHLANTLPTLRIANIQQMNARKGVFSMDTLEKTIITSFAKHGVDLRDKVIADAPQKLFIQASNLTTCRTVWLTGQVPIIKAILCSCCIPFVFEPQVLYNNLYIDGGIFETFIHKIVPKDCLVFHLRREVTPMLPESVATTSMYDLLVHIFIVKSNTEFPSNVVLFTNNNIRSLQELSPTDKIQLFDCGLRGVNRFFAQRLPQESN
jgi:NTE family protein